MKLFAMVSTRHSLPYTAVALSTFFAHTELTASDRFLLIDNDGSLPDELIKFHPRIELLRNPAPLGFGANANRTIPLALAAGADLVFMNNDLVFTPGWRAPLETDHSGILSPLSNREVQYATSVVVSKTQHVSELFVLNMRMRLEDYLGHEDSVEHLARIHRRTGQGYWAVCYLPFFCVALSQAVLQAVGRFDESFGEGGGEDYDYCIRAALAGYDTRYAIASLILHFGGKSSYDVPEERARFEAREAHFKQVFANKWGHALHDLMMLEQTKALDEEVGKDNQERLPRELIAQLAAPRGQAIKL